MRVGCGDIRVSVLIALFVVVCASAASAAVGLGDAETLRSCVCAMRVSAETGTTIFDDTSDARSGAPCSSNKRTKKAKAPTAIRAMSCFAETRATRRAGGIHAQGRRVPAMPGRDGYREHAAVLVSQGASAGIRPPNGSGHFWSSVLTRIPLTRLELLQNCHRLFTGTQSAVDPVNLSLT